MKLVKVLGIEKGQSIVEITLITPLLLVALYIPIDFGIALFTAHLAQNAAREGVRIAAILPDCSASAAPCVSSGPPVTESCPGASTKVGQEVCDRLPQLLKSNIANVTITLTGNLGDECRRMVTVDVAGNYDFSLYHLMALIGFPLSNSTLPVNRSAEARYELQPVTNTDTSCP